MNPIAHFPLERTRSLTRSTSSPNLVPERSVSKPRRPRSSLSRAYTSHCSRSEAVEARSGGENGEEEDANEIEIEEEEKESSWTGIAEDLEQVIVDRRERKKRGRSDDEERNWEEGDEGEGEGEGESGNTILDSFEKMSLPSRDDDDDKSQSTTSNLSYLRGFRQRSDRRREPEAEEESTCWNPEVFTSNLILQGAGGGRARPQDSLSLKGKNKVCYEVPGERESWDAKVVIEIVENAGSPSSNWSFDKLVGSPSVVSRKEREVERERSGKEGRNRAIDRLSLLEQQLSWVAI